MKTTGRMALAIVLLLVGGLMLPRPAARVFAGDALAQVPLPSPTLPDILPSPDPDPSDPPDTPPPPDPGDGSGGGGGGGDGELPGGGGGGGGNVPDPGDGNGVRGNRGGTRGGPGGKDPIPGFFHVPGSYDTEALLAVAARLRALGWSTEQVQKKVFAPFIIGGRSNWVDTWGAPRYGPGPVVRTHEGQDVFCEYGDPVLASESGTVDYGDGGLGGKVARLHRPDGGYWYYAHLSGYNNQEFPAGSSVEAGDVIGFCGNTGNAITSPPHVHFGWYQAGGGAKNPMRSLVRWLREAEDNAARIAGVAHGKRLRQIVSLTAERRFGDAYSPDLSELEFAPRPFWSQESSPATSALTFASSALESAIDGISFGRVAAVRSLTPGASVTAGVTMDRRAQLGGVSATQPTSFAEQAD